MAFIARAAAPMLPVREVSTRTKRIRASDAVIWSIMSGYFVKNSLYRAKRA